MGLFALLEHRVALGKSCRTGLAQDFAELIGAKSREQRQMGNQRRIDCGHVFPALSAGLIKSWLQLYSAIEQQFALAQQFNTAMFLYENQNPPPVSRGIKEEQPDPRKWRRRRPR